MSPTSVWLKHLSVKKAKKKKKKKKIAGPPFSEILDPPLIISS